MCTQVADGLRASKKRGDYIYIAVGLRTDGEDDDEDSTERLASTLSLLVKLLLLKLVFMSLSMA